MLTRWRIARTLIVFLVSILVVLYTAARIFILNSFEDLERQLIHTQIDRVNDALGERFNALGSKTGDWATWDETYEFIAGENPEFAVNEITQATLKQLQINLILFVNPDGKLIYHQAFDLETGTIVEFKHADQINLDKFLETLAPDSHLDGLVLLPAQPMLIAARPLVTSEGQGPARGALVFGRYLDAREMDQLAQTTHLDLTLHRLDASLPTDELQHARAALSSEQTGFVQPLDDLVIAGYAIQTDIANTPIAIIRIEYPRVVYQQGWASTRYFIIALALLATIFAILALILGDRLARSQQQQRASEQLYYALAEAAPDAIYVVDQTGRVKYANETAARAFATNWQTIVGDPAAPAPDQPNAEIRAVIETRQAVQVERQLNHSDHPLWLDIKMVPLGNDQGVSDAVLGIARDMTERKNAEERVASQLRRLSALHAIDQAITSSVDLQSMLNVLTAQTATQLNADAVQVLLFDAMHQTLKSTASVGFPRGVTPRPNCDLNDPLAGYAARECKTIWIQDRRQIGFGLQVRDTWFAERFGFGAASPIMAHGRVKGVLEVFRRAPLAPNTDWLNFLGTLAGQAAIAVDSVQMFDHLQQSHLELASAYETTIEGWSRALYLREGETTEHAGLIADLTIQLLRALGVKHADWVNVRRGALLHDLGNMVIPDAILLKPGALTDAERAVMQMHPHYAYEILYPIPYLRPALEIPCCHHERWDGSGYPSGLRGEAIPIAARAFAVVDVWDALRSHRPYRAVWRDDHIREHLRAHAGTLFDPRAVAAFLELPRAQSG